MECQKELMAAGKAYRRTCGGCNFGPCRKGYDPKWTPDNPVGKGPACLREVKFANGYHTVDLSAVHVLEGEGRVRCYARIKEDVPIGGKPSYGAFVGQDPEGVERGRYTGLLEKYRYVSRSAVFEEPPTGCEQVHGKQGGGLYAFKHVAENAAPDRTCCKCGIPLRKRWDDGWDVCVSCRAVTGPVEPVNRPASLAPMVPVLDGELDDDQLWVIEQGADDTTRRLVAEVRRLRGYARR